MDKLKTPPNQYREMDRRQFLIKTGEGIVGLGLLAILGGVIHETFKPSTREQKRKQTRLERYLETQNDEGYIDNQYYWVGWSGEQRQNLTFWVSDKTPNLQRLRDQYYPDGEVDNIYPSYECTEKQIVGTMYPDGSMRIALIRPNPDKPILNEYTPNGNLKTAWHWNSQQENWTNKQVKSLN